MVTLSQKELQRMRVIEKAVQEMLIPEMVLRDAVQGKLGLTRGQWVKLGQLLKLPTNFQLLTSGRNGAPCWEVCYPPVPVKMDKEQVALPPSR